MQVRKWDVYKITNPDGKFYIGRTCNLKKRLIFHFCRPLKHNKLVLESIEKFNREEHTVEVIDSFSSDESFANGKEVFWIRTYMSNIHKWPDGNGMNMTDGGKSLKGYKRSMATIEKDRLAKMGVGLSEETRKNISNALKGKKHTPERIKNVQDALRRSGGDSWYISKPKAVIQYSLNGEFIREFNSIKEVCEYFNVVHNGGVSRACTGKAKTFHGFKFKYKELDNVQWSLPNFAG